jgi:hypothetical protein
MNRGEPLWSVLMAYGVIVLGIMLILAILMLSGCRRPNSEEIQTIEYPAPSGRPT